MTGILGTGRGSGRGVGWGGPFFSLRADHSGPWEGPLAYVDTAPGKRGLRQLTRPEAKNGTTPTHPARNNHRPRAD